MLDLKISIFLPKIGENSKNSKFRYKSSEYQNLPCFLLIQKENSNSNMFCKFQHHSMQIFFKMANYFFLKTEKVTTTPPHPLTLTAYPTPGKVVPPLFFHENDRKGCKRDYLLCPW